VTNYGTTAWGVTPEHRRIGFGPHWRRQTIAYSNEAEIRLLRTRLEIDNTRMYQREEIYQVRQNKVAR